MFFSITRTFFFLTVGQNNFGNKIPKTLIVFLPFAEYHNALVQNGVSDYDWTRFALDFEKAIVQRVLSNINLCNMVNLALPVVEFSRKGYKIRKDSGLKSTVVK
jgi:hypothetical protein